MTRAGLLFDLPPTIKQTQTQLQQAEALLREHHKHSYELCQSELQAQIALATAEGKRGKTKILQAIYRIEATSKTY